MTSIVNSDKHCQYEQNKAHLDSLLCRGHACELSCKKRRYEKRRYGRWQIATGNIINFKSWPPPSAARVWANLTGSTSHFDCSQSSTVRLFTSCESRFVIALVLRERDSHLKEVVGLDQHRGLKNVLCLEDHLHHHHLHLILLLLLPSSL